MASTIKQLRLALEIVEAVYGEDIEVQVWLPHIHIELDPVLITRSAQGTILIQGNVALEKRKANDPTKSS
jgi:hypothetical protein